MVHAFPVTCTPRILAVGGTRFSERARLGHWPVVSDAALYDTTGLDDAGRIAFGCGRVGEGWCLILRQQQTLADRGGYAYTVLIDLGASLWEECQWNSAAAIAAILSDSILARLCLEEPERLAGDPDRFVDLFQQKRAGLMSKTALAQDAPHIREALARRLSADVGDVAVVRDRSASPEYMARALADVPLCLRGIGWFVTGSPTIAHAFGASLLIEADRADASVDLGTRTIDSLQRLWQSAAPNAVSRTFLAMPRWLWSGDHRLIGAQLCMLGQLQDAPAAQLRGQVPDVAAAVAGPLGAEVRAALVQQLDDGSVQYDAPTSEFAAELWLEGGADLPARCVQAIAAESLVEWLRRHASLPDRLPSAAALDDGQWLAIWRDALRGVPQPSDQVSRLAVASAGELNANGLPTTRFMRLRYELLTEQISAQVPLASWATATDLLDGDCVASLRQAVRTRLLMRHATAHEDYLLLGGDLNGKWLEANASHEAKSVALAALAMLAEPEGLRRNRARAWLAGIGQGALRRRLDMDLRFRIAEAIGDSWADLARVRRFWATADEAELDGLELGGVALDEMNAVFLAGDQTGRRGLSLGALVRIASPTPAELVSACLRSPRTLAPDVFLSNVQWLIKEEHLELLVAWLRCTATEGSLPALPPDALPFSVLNALLREWLLDTEAMPGAFTNALQSLVGSALADCANAASGLALRRIVDVTDLGLLARGEMALRLARTLTLLRFAACALPPDLFAGLFADAEVTRPAGLNRAFGRLPLSEILSDANVTGALRSFFSSQHGSAALAGLPPQWRREFKTRRQGALRYRSRLWRRR